tara:strand:- start:848 stop:1174 length:327 start_codon:yes stop_codon:yes gene_type:complete
MALKNKAILLELKAIMKMRPNKKNHKGKAIISKDKSKIGKAIISFNDETGFQCIDIIMISNTAFTYKTFRRDPEDQTGWFPSGEAGDLYASKEAAILAAEEAIDWFKA